MLLNDMELKMVVGGWLPVSKTTLEMGEEIEDVLTEEAKVVFFDSGFHTTGNW